MTIRRLWILTAVLGVIAGGGLRAQDADKPSQPTEPAARAVDWFVTSGYDNTALNNTAFSFFANTHGNTLGVEVAPAEEALRAQLGIEPETGVVVTSIAPESAALKAGLKQHDVVLKLGDEPAVSPERFHELVGSRQGQEVTFEVLRQGKPANVILTLPKVPVYGIDFDVFSAVADSRRRHYRIGVTLAEADDTLRSQLNLAAGEGLVVTEVVADSPAAKAGLERHDVLVKLDDQRLTTVEKVNALIQEIKDRQVTVVFLRGGEELSREIAPRLSSDPYRLVFPETQLRNFSVELQDEFQDYNVAPKEYRYWTVKPRTRSRVQWVLDPDAAPASPADQIARLKKQLAELQSTVEALENSLRAAPAEQQTETPQKPETSPEDE